MRYSVEPRDRIYVKGYGFLSFAKNMGKGLSNKYAQKLIDSARKSTTGAIKTASKRVIEKTAEATRDIIDNKIADKITTVSTKVHSKKPSNNNNDNNNSNNNINNNNNNNNNKYNEDVISPEERQQIINKLRLVPKKEAYF